MLRLFGKEFGSTQPVDIEVLAMLCYAMLCLFGKEFGSTQPVDIQVLAMLCYAMLVREGIRELPWVLCVRHEEGGSQWWVELDSQGWADGRLVGECGVANRGWFPHNFVKLMRPWYFCSVYDLSLTLVPNSLP